MFTTPLTTRPHSTGGCESVSAPDYVDDVGHHAGEVVVLGGVDGGDPGAQENSGVGIGNDATDNHRDVFQTGFTKTLHDLGNEFHVRAGEDREADAVDVLGNGCRDDLRGRKPDALVDDLEAHVASAYGDLLGAVG